MGVLSGLLRSGFRRYGHRRDAVHATKSLALSLAFAWGAALFGLHLSAQAQPQAPETPALVSTALGQARLAGTSRFTYWGFEVYQATLWVAPDFRLPSMHDAAYALDLRYLRAFKGKDIAQRSLDEMRRVQQVPETRAQAWLKLMQDTFPDVKEGDRLTGIHLPGKGVRFLLNGQALGEVADAEFARVFFGIWLSDKTSEPKLRQALLGPTLVATQP